MKKTNLLLIPILLSSIQLTACGNTNLNTITVAEVTHSLFYAPMYIAKNAGFFNEVGLDIDIITTPGVMRNVSGNKKNQKKRTNWTF